MPESHEDHDVFWGEYFWAPRYRHNHRTEMGAVWTTPSERLPFSLMVSVEGYSWSSREDDCSLDDGASIQMPCKDVVETLELSSNGQEGRWFDSSGDLVAFDPNVYEPGPSSFLIREDTLTAYLAKRNLAIVWTVLSEKQVLGELGGTIEQCPFTDFSGAYLFSSGEAIGSVTARIKDYSAENIVIKQVEAYRNGVASSVSGAKAGKRTIKKSRRKTKG